MIDNFGVIAEIIPPSLSYIQPHSVCILLLKGSQLTINYRCSLYTIFRECLLIAWVKSKNFNWRIARAERVNNFPSVS